MAVVHLVILINESYPQLTPKSANLSVYKLPESNIFDGFKSEWTIPFSWMNSKARLIWRKKFQTRDSLRFGG